MYVLASRLDAFVGITATSRVTARTATSGAACRYWEHLVKIRKPAARGPSAEPSRKVACFRQCRAGHVAMLVEAPAVKSLVWKPPPLLPAAVVATRWAPEEQG